MGLTGNLGGAMIALNATTWVMTIENPAVLFVLNTTAVRWDTKSLKPDVGSYEETAKRKKVPQTA